MQQIQSSVIPNQETQTRHLNSLPLCKSVRQNQPAHAPTHTQLWSFPRKEFFHIRKVTCEEQLSLCTSLFFVERLALSFPLSAHCTRRLHVSIALLISEGNKHESFITPTALPLSNRAVNREATERHHQNRCLKLEFCQ